MVTKKVWLLLVVLFMTLNGCREVNDYGYKSSQSKFSDGELTIIVVGRYGENYEKNGKQLLDWGFPYHLEFTYIVPENRELLRFEVKDIVLTGIETGSIHKLASVQSDSARIYESGKLIRLAAGPLTEEEYIYQNYKLNATVVIYKNESSFEEKEISIVLETDYKKQRRSDGFDKFMSV